MKLFLIDKNDIATIAREEVLRNQYHFEIGIRDFDAIRCSYYLD